MIQDVIAQYRQVYQEHGYSPKSMFCLKDRQEEIFGALTATLRQEPFSVLDYGCGLAYLKEYLDTRFHNYEYIGVDIVPDFTQANRQRYPGIHFETISSPEDILETYDYILISGVFNLLYQGYDPEAQQQFVFDTLKTLFQKTRRTLAVNFMTTQVDFVQPNAYHQNPLDLYRFAVENLSRRVRLDQSYMPYEFTFIIYQDQEIVRPKCIYNPA